MPFELDLMSWLLGFLWSCSFLAKSAARRVRSGMLLDSIAVRVCFHQRIGICLVNLVCRSILTLEVDLEQLDSSFALNKR